MGTGMFDRDTLVADEWRLRSVDLIIGPAPGCGSPVDRAA
jgi:hypothetical protein